MRSRRKKRSELWIIAVVAIGLGVLNFLFRRFIDGSLCLTVGIVALVIWLVKRKK